MDHKKEKVYLMRAGSYYKIGVSAKPKERIDDLQTACPESIKLMGTITMNNPYALEGYLHDLFSNKNTHGEWFRLNILDEFLMGKLFDNAVLSCSIQDNIKEEPELVYKKALQNLRH